MMRLCTLAAFVSGASALHLSGPMDDRLSACAAEHCPDSWGSDPEDYDGMGISFPTFVNPATGNSGRFLYDLDYVLDVLGYDTEARPKGAYTYYDGDMTTATCVETAQVSVTADATACTAAGADEAACEAVMKSEITASAGSAATCAATAAGTDDEACACVTDLGDATACEAAGACTYTGAVAAVLAEAACTYTPAAREQKTRTAVSSDGADHLDCMCKNCATTVEAIFQPVSRDLCKVISNVDLPCGTELAACEAEEGALRTSGTAATFDSIYPNHGGPGDVAGMGAPSPNQCSPAASFLAYKNDWKLNEFAAEADDGTCTKAGAAAACVAKDAADADACGAAADQTACEAIETAASDATCVAIAAADNVACAAVTDLDDATACDAVKTDATETCLADGAENGAAVDPGACTYTPAAAAADKCDWEAAGADTVLSAEVVAYQKCIAASRAAAFEADFNCLTNVGASTCGGEYECTYVEPVEEDDKTSGATTTTVAACIVALVAANL